MRHFGRNVKKGTLMFLHFKRLKHQQYLTQLPKLPQKALDIQTLYSPADFRLTLIEYIKNATQRIYLVALYLENDDAGRDILNALYSAKRNRPELDIILLVDWHRAQRGRFGEGISCTNADWYCEMAQQHPDITLPIFGVPVNTREVLGVLHLKGFIIDDTVIYSGASLNNVYLHQNDKYRYDRYQLLTNSELAKVMVAYITQHLLSAEAIQHLDRLDRPKNSEIKNITRRFRTHLKFASYNLDNNATNDELAVTPLVGLGKQNILNQTIHHLISSTHQTLILCTPYFNLPACLIRDIVNLLRQGKQIEIIIGDKTANDFFIPEDQPFKMIGALPYLYEINLRRFLERLHQYVKAEQLIVRLWKADHHSYHLKGIWVDDTWRLLTGNNLNPRAWRLDLENAILIHDPKQETKVSAEQELACIRRHTKIVNHYTELEEVEQYPLKVRTLIRRLCRVRIDRLINRIL